MRGPPPPRLLRQAGHLPWIKSPGEDPRGATPKNVRCCPTRHLLPIPAGVTQVPPDAPFKKTLAAFAGKDAVVLPARFVAAHHAIHLDARLVVVAVLLVAGATLGGCRVVFGIPGVALLHPVGVSVGVSPAPSHHGHIALDAAKGCACTDRSLALDPTAKEKGKGEKNLPDAAKSNWKGAGGGGRESTNVEDEEASQGQEPNQELMVELLVSTEGP